jgi:hypothetical protein
MKTDTSLVIAIIAFSMFASNAFALFKSPYPRRASRPDDSIVIADNQHEWIKTTLRTSR